MNQGHVMGNIEESAGERVKILLVDDEASIRKLLTAIITEMDMDIILASDGAEAWMLFQEFEPEIVVTDIKMPRMNGIELLEKIRKLSQEAEVIIITGFADVDLVTSALRLGASDLIEKPFAKERVLDHVGRSKERVLNRLNKKSLELQLERERKQRELSDRMATVGRLMGGLAHEIHNPLTFLKGNAELVKRMLIDAPDNLDPSKEIIPLLEDVEYGAKRIEALVSNMRRFSGSPKETKSTLKLAEVMKDCVKLSASRLSGNIKFVMTEAPGELTIDVNRVDIESCLINLIVNSFEAVGDKGGQVEFYTKPSTKEGHTEIHIRDNGPGFDPKLGDKLFNPFYSEKSGGMGLGLSIAYEAAKRNEATVEISSQATGGTLAVVTIPTFARSGEETNGA